MVPIKRTCDVENLADFVRYYHGSWIGWHHEKENFIQPCYVDRALDGAHVLFRPLSKNDGAFLLGMSFPANWQDIQGHVDFGVPEIGMMPDGPTIQFSAYTSPRAARKGYRPRDAKCLDFNNWDIRRKYASRNPGDKYDWIWFAFNPSYTSLEDAEAILSKGEAVGLPISRTLGVYSTPKFRHSLLAYKRWTIGHVASPTLIQLKREYEDYEEDIARQTGAEVLVG